MRKLVAIAKALSDENRLRILTFLEGREPCVCQIIEMLHLAPSTVSRHMSVLHQADLVHSRKDGRWVYYFLPGAEAGAAVREALAWVQANLEASPQVEADCRRLREVCRLDREHLCQRYHARIRPSGR